MRILKISSIILLVILVAIIATIYFLLSPLYKNGSVIIDAILVIIGTAGLMLRFLPQPQANTNSTQFYAVTQVVSAAGVSVFLLAVLHTILSILLDYDLTLPFVIFVGIVVLYHVFRISAVSVSSSMQIATDNCNQVQRESRANIVELIEKPAKALQTEILNIQTEDFTVQQEAINSIKNVVFAVKSLPANHINQLQDLQLQLSNWATSLEMMTKRISKTSEESERIELLKEIIGQSQSFLGTIKNL